MTAFLPSFLPSRMRCVGTRGLALPVHWTTTHPGWLAGGPHLSPLITSPGLFLQCNLSININPIQCTPNNRKFTHCNLHACYISKLLWLTVRELCMQPVCVCVCVYITWLTKGSSLPSPYEQVAAGFPGHHLLAGTILTPVRDKRALLTWANNKVDESSKANTPSPHCSSSATGCVVVVVVVVVRTATFLSRCALNIHHVHKIESSLPMISTK